MVKPVLAILALADEQIRTISLKNTENGMNLILVPVLSGHMY